MRRFLLALCLALTIACKETTSTQVYDDGSIHTPPDLQAMIDADGIASVVLPTRPVKVACYFNQAPDDAWRLVYQEFYGYLDYPWCALTRTNGEWRLSLFSPTILAGSTAGFVVVY